MPKHISLLDAGVYKTDLKLRTPSLTALPFHCLDQQTPAKPQLDGRRKKEQKGVKADKDLQPQVPSLYVHTAL